MTRRLQDLQRQRALIQEHLQWLDKEIAELTATDPKVATIPAAPDLLVPPISPVLPEVVSAHAEEILAEYEKNPADLRQNVRNGCLLYFVLALASVILVVVLIHYGYSHGH